ncbi:lipid droplet-associated protein [Tsukamurella asaccharolytica]|uniref:Lipid droplet-associated protein n=1 Tax=Tsukamurella asaccharolytica TaxID=2592067 RepID=A0A5C5R861_9ACTN|nr:lipid droplet-associated protein [Tsukamurella asaccharolytica]TWS19018.1 lipid droplet-associated protein [Tsukamurella asaccharolytica]
MSRLPFVVRVAVGAVALAAEKGQEIVGGAVNAPLTLGSKSAQAFIHVQQDLAELAVRGDRAIESVFPAKAEEQAAWATFDDDEDVDVDVPASKPAFGEVRPATEPARADGAQADVATAPEKDGADQAPSGAGRYALYSTSPAPAPSDASAAAETPDDLPAVARRIDYPELTLAQLRGRLPGLTTPEVESLVEYERGHKARPPFLTMLENRITR